MPMAPGGWGPYLDRGERLLWQGAPSTAPTARLPDVVFVLIGLFLIWSSTPHVLWPGFAEITIDETPADPRSTEARLIVWGMLFAGLHLAFGRAAFGYFRRKGTRYALTDKRALIATSFFGRRLRSQPIAADAPIEFEPGRLANIVFVSDADPDGEGDPMRRRIAFDRIADGEAVMALVRTIQSGASARDGGEAA